MKYFKVINMNRQKTGPFVVPELGYKQMQKMKELKDQIHLMGECDKNGNILTEIAANNFTSKPNTSENGKAKRGPKSGTESITGATTGASPTKEVEAGANTDEGN